MSKKILIVVAHPDDEVLGMGGTIIKHVEQGNQVHVLFLSDGVSSREEVKVDAKVILKRRCAAEKACEIMGATIVSFESFPDNSFDSIPLLGIVKKVEDVKTLVNPDLIYTHHGGDLNIDHRRCTQAVLTAFRPQPNEVYQAIYSFEVPSSTEWSHPSVTLPFNPNIFVNVEAYLEKLLMAYTCYTEEVRDDPHSRSVKALEYNLRQRGRQVGLYAAEAFMVLRQIER